MPCLFSVCSLPDPKWGRAVEVEVLLASPPLPFYGTGGVGHRVLLPGENSDDAPRELTVAPGRGSVRIDIAKRTNLPVLDYPLIDGRSDLLKPAGGIYPMSLDERGRLTMSYRDGFLAELLFPVSRAGSLLEAVNTERMSNEIWSRSSGDPWTLDRDVILETLLYGSMRSDRIRRRLAFDLSLDVAPGTWFAGDPFIGPFEAGVERPRLELKEMPTGVHHFFRSLDGTIDRVDLLVTETGWLAVSSLTGAAGSGRW